MEELSNWKVFIETVLERYTIFINVKRSGKTFIWMSRVVVKKYIRICKENCLEVNCRSLSGSRYKVKKVILCIVCIELYEI